MNIFERFSRVAKANVNELLNKMEDPEKVMNQAVEDLQKDLVKIRQSYAEVMATQKRMEKQRAAAEQLANEWLNRAQLALQNEDEELAREALSRKGVAQDQAATLAGQLETQASAGLEPQRPASPSLRRKALEGRRVPSLQRVREQPLVLIVPRARGQSKEELSSFLELLKAPRSGKLSDEGSMALRRALDARGVGAP